VCARSGETVVRARTVEVVMVGVLHGRPRLRCRRAHFDPCLARRAQIRMAGEGLSGRITPRVGGSVLNDDSAPMSASSVVPVAPGRVNASV
jgi:hypothetical protein